MFCCSLKQARHAVTFWRTILLPKYCLFKYLLYYI